MQIRSVRLKNIKSYDSMHVEFSPGMNAVMGHNGAGKSTIVEAIGFALFDVMDYVREQFVREGATDGKVEVVFHSVLDGRAYLVERAVRGAQYSVADCESNVVLARGREAANGFIRHHLGLSETVDSKQLFAHAVGVAQGNLTAIFGETATNRAAVFNRLLEVEEYGAANTALRDTKSHLDNLENDSARTIARLEGALLVLPETRRRAAEISRLQGEKSALLSVRRKALADAEAERAGHEVRKSAAEQAAQALRLAQLQRESSIAGLAHAQAERAHALEAGAIVAANSEGHALHLEVQKRRAQLAAEQRERQQLLNSRAVAEREHARAEVGAQQSQARLKEIATAAARAETLRAPAAQQEELRGRLETATSEAATLQAMQEALASLAGQLQSRRAQQTTLASQLQQAAKAQAEIERCDAELESVAQQLVGLEQRLADVTAEGIAAKQHQEQLEGTGAVCPVCKRTIDEHLRHNLLEHDRQVRDRNKRIVLEARTEKENATAARAELERKRSQLIGAMRSLADQKAVDAAGAEIAALELQHSKSLARVQAVAGAPAQVQQLRDALQALGDPQRERAVALAQAAAQQEVAAALAAAQAQLQRLQAELTRIDAQLAPFAALDAAVEQADRDAAETQAAYQAVLAHSHSADQLPQREAAVQAAQAAEQKAAAALAQAEAGAQAVTAAYSAEAHARAASAVAELTHAVGSLVAELGMLKSEGEAKAADIKRLKAEERKLQAAAAERDQIALRQRTLAKLRSVIKEAGPQITRLRIRRVSTHAATLYSELANDYATRLQWDEEYAIGLEVEGRVRPFKSLSGGEQMIAALAVRLALLREMSGIRMAFFDEPTANLDPQRRERLAQQLSAIKGFEQIFVISHDDTFDSSTVNVVRLTKENGSTRLMAA